MTGTPDAGESPAPPLDRLEGYFAQVTRAFESAVDRAGGIQRSVQVGDRVLRLCFAGESLVGALLPAFAHLLAEDHPRPHATIGLWDTAATGVDLPRPSWRGGTIVRGLLSGYTHGLTKSAWEQSSDGFSIVHTGRRAAFFHVPGADSLPPQESSFPLRTLLNWWLGAEGLPLVHAGAVGTEHGAVLLAGMGGSGKSNTALACLDRGLLYAGDDFVAVQPEHARVFSLYSAAKVHPGDLLRFPALRRAVVHPGGPGRDKAVLQLYPHFGSQLVSSLPLRAILLPRVARRTATELTPASPAAALRYMAPSTLLHLPGARHVEFQAMARLAARIPSYVLDLGTRHDEVAAAIRRLIDTVVLATA